MDLLPGKIQDDKISLVTDKTTNNPEDDDTDFMIMGKGQLFMFIR